MIKTALGGRIAEEIFYDSVTTGASDDINKVTRIAQGLVQTYGMTNNIGLVGYGSMGDENSFQKPFSDETNWEIDEEVRNIVKEQYALTKALLMEHKDKVTALGDLLLEKETINLPDIVGVLGDRPFGMSETITEYLDELKQRTQKEEEDKLKAEEEAEVEAAKSKLDEDLEKESDKEDKGEEIIEKEEEKKKLSIFHGYKNIIGLKQFITF